MRNHRGRVGGRNVHGLLVILCVLCEVVRAISVICDPSGWIMIHSNRSKRITIRGRPKHIDKSIIW